MDLKTQLLKEHSAANRNRIVAYVGHDAKRFAELITVYVAGPYRITQRAAWPLSTIVEHYPNLIKPHLKHLLDFVQQPNAHVAVKRNTMRLLQFIAVPKRLQGKVAEICFRFLSDKKETVAVRVFSMTVLVNVAIAEPALSREIRLLVEDQLPNASAGFRSRASRELKRLDKIS